MFLDLAIQNYLGFHDHFMIFYSFYLGIFYPLLLSSWLFVIAQYLTFIRTQL